ncbi:hypothetical protein BGZ67_006387 [Mortierella alpina]|nr:hypothetical protein BGZ67_006387 [Mortierella alpina]
MFSSRQPYWQQSLHQKQQQQQQQQPGRRYPTLVQIQTNARHIHQLRYLGGEYPFLQYILPFCTQLRHLEVTLYSDDVKQLLQQNSSTLETFICRSDPLTRQTQDPVVLDKVFYLLAEMPNLRVLELDAVIVSDYEGQLFGRVCQRLSHLSLIESKLIERPKFSSPEAEAEGFANLRSLVLDRSYLPNDHQLQTFQACPAIEHLTWKSRAGKLPIMNFLFFLSSGRFHSVSSLDLSDASAMSDLDFASVLKYTPQLTCMNAKGTLFGREATKVLLEHHRHPLLKRLNTLDCPNFTALEAQDVLEHCEQLQIFYAPAVSATEMGRIRWRCLQLRELDICITEIDQLPLRTPHHRHHEIYQQLAALTQLRVLRLGDPGRPSFTPPSSNPQRRPSTNRDINMHPPPIPVSSMLDLTLDSGIGALSTLTRLQELDCEKMQARMEFMELQWIVQTWRRLERLVGCVHPNQAQRDLSIEFLRDMVPGLQVYQTRMEIWMAEL